MAQWVFRALGHAHIPTRQLMVIIYRSWHSNLCICLGQLYTHLGIGYGQPSSLARRMVNGNLFPLPTWAISSVRVCVCAV